MSWNPGALALTVALALSGAAQAQVPSALPVFRQLCIDTRADRAAALQAAKAQGWVEPPEALTASVSQMQLTDPVVLARLAPKTILFMVVGGMKSPLPTVSREWSACAIAMMPGESGLTDRVRQWLGVEPARTEAAGETATFLFTTGPNGRRALSGASDPEVAAAAKSGALAFVNAQTSDNMAVLVYAGQKQ